jgi:hypothetical protein
VQQQIHHAKPMRIRYKLGPYERVVALKEGFLLGQLEEIVGAILDITVNGDEKAGSASSRILNGLTGLRLYQSDDAIDQRTRREILTSA